MERQNQLQQSRNSGRRLQVTNVRLDGAQPTGAIRRAVFHQDVSQRADFDRIAQRRARAVRFDEADVVRVATGVGHRLLDDSLLRRAVRCRQTVGQAILRDGRTGNHGPDVVAVGHGVRQPLEHHHAAAFAAYVSIGAGVEGLAAPVRCHHACLRQRNRAFRREDQIHAAGDAQIRFTLPQALARQMCGCQ